MKKIKIKITKEDFRRKLNIKDGLPGKTPTKKELISLIKPLIPKPVKGDKGETPNDRKLLSLIKPLVKVPPEPDTPEQVRDKLSKLQGKNRLNVSAIEGIEEIENSLRAAHLEAQSYNNSFLRFAGDTVLTHDLSSSLDGSTKTFPLPANARVLLILTSSFPNILRPTVDYTHTASTVTFTDEVPAAATLAEGQTVVILYKLP